MFYYHRYGLVEELPTTAAALPQLLQSDIIYDDRPTLEFREYRNWSWSYNLNLIGKDQLPNRQQDWPVPASPEPNPRRSWEWWYNLKLIGKDILPFRNPTPLPDQITWYRDWFQNLLQTTLKPVAAAFPLNQYDWKLPLPISWYQFWSQSPAIPPISATGGRQVFWDEIEAIERLSASFLREHGAPIPKFRTPESQAASRLGYRGGIASGISRRK